MFITRQMWQVDSAPSQSVPSQAASVGWNCFMTMGSGSCLLYNYIDSWPLSSLHDFGDIGVLCTFLNKPPAAAGILGFPKARSWAAHCQGRRSVIAGGTARPPWYKSLPLHPSPPAGREVRRVGSALYGLRPLWAWLCPSLVLSLVGILGV